MKRTRVVLDRPSGGQASLARGGSDAKATPSANTNNGDEDLAKSRGHRYGNFHNYYNFHPTEERTKLLTKEGGILDYVAKRWLEGNQPSQVSTTGDDNPSKKLKREERDKKSEDSPSTVFEFLDIGCNEGDLTMEVATALQNRLDNHLVQVMGVDLDPVLIKRAVRKYVKEKTKKQKPSFQVCNILTDGWPQDQTVDLTSIFSTTMWIHIAGGDEGLKRVLADTCKHTKRFILIEPQPSKCYRNASLRLRKMGLPEFDVSAERLHLRARIDEEINTIMAESSFARVVDFSLGNGEISPSDQQEGEKTTWNRSLWLYERVAAAS